MLIQISTVYFIYLLGGLPWLLSDHPHPCLPSAAALSRLEKMAFPYVLPFCVLLITKLLAYKFRYTLDEFLASSLDFSFETLQT